MVRANTVWQEPLLALLLVLCGGASGSSACQLGAVQFPLRLDPDGRRLEDVLGRPFLVNGDSAWSLMVMLTKPQVESYFDDRRQKGFNSVLVNLIERGYGGPANTDGQLPFVPADDYTAPNEAYFAHADRVIDEAAERDMLVLLISTPDTARGTTPPSNATTSPGST